VLPGLAAAQVLPSASPEAVGMSSHRLQRLDDAMQREVADGRLPGAVVAVARRGKLVYHEAFGRLSPGGPPMRKDAIFQIASMTKPLTTVGALMLQEEGRLLLNDPVDAYLTELAGLSVAVMSDDGQRVVRTEPLRRRVTLADLFQHTAGIPNGFVGSTDLHLRYQPIAPAQNPRMTGEAFLAGLRALPLHFQPGAEWEYGWGIDVAGLVLERITGQSLDRLLAERLFGPLGMTDTGFVIPASKAERYAPAPASGERAAVDATAPRAMACGGACAVSTAMDYLRFAQMLLNRGVLGDTRMLSRKSVEAMTADQLGGGVRRDRLHAYPGLNGGYGFGLGVAVRSATGVAGMMGTAGDYHWGGGVGTYFWVDPQEELAVVFMTAAPPEARLRPRQLLPALVLQAIVE
jgi:CubicO group peptidase (beta-lactamase class C family)